MKFYLITMLILCASLMQASAQSPIDRVLAEVERNNKTIFAGKSYAEAKKAGYRTGLTPSDPRVVYDLLYGSPVEAGNQKEFSIIQSFDFPTTYARRSRLANESMLQTEFEYEALRQSVLLETKLVLIEWIYRNKLDSMLLGRKNDARALVDAIQKSVDAGDGNMVDLNKAALRLIEDTADHSANESKMQQLENRLTELNGGMAASLAGLAYEPLVYVPDLETILVEHRSADPVRNYLEKERNIGQHEIAVAKSLSLPKLEIGYLHHTVLDQRFNGIHLGLSIPVWENKNEVKARQAELLTDEARVQEYATMQHGQIGRLHEQVTSMGETIQAYKRQLASSDNLALLNKSLTLGNISIIDYLVELNFYYSALQKSLEIEMEYYKAVAELFKYKL